MNVEDLRETRSRFRPTTATLARLDEMLRYRMSVRKERTRMMRSIRERNLEKIDPRWRDAVAEIRKLPRHEQIKLVEKMYLQDRAMHNKLGATAYDLEDRAVQNNG